MRTNIVLDDILIEKALRFSPMKTKKDTVNLALKEFVEQHSRLNLLDMKGKIRFADGYDYKKMRRSRRDNGAR